MQVIDSVRSFVLENFCVADPDVLFDDTPLLGAGLVDSVGVLEIVGFIETTFGVSVEDRDMLPEHLGSIDAIARFVTGRLAAAESVAAV